MIVAALAACLVATAAAQRPERPRTIRLPGLDIVLPAGWQLILFQRCRFVVPNAWRSTGETTLVVAADEGRLSGSRLDVSSWSAHKAQVRAAYGPTATSHEDSDRRLWLEVGDERGTHHYIAAAAEAGACIGLLDLPRTTALSGEEIRRIAEGVAPAPERWSPGSE